MLKKLKIAFEFDSYRQLAEKLGVKYRTLQDWKGSAGLPDNIQGLMGLILKQQKEIWELKKELRKFKGESDA